MPRELLLPIPHAIADKVHHALLNAANAQADTAMKTEQPPLSDINAANELYDLAEKLDTLAREAGVLGW